MDLPEKLEDLTQEQKEKLAEIGFYYIKTMLKELEIENVMQEMSYNLRNDMNDRRQIGYV